MLEVTKVVASEAGAERTGIDDLAPRLDIRLLRLAPGELQDRHHA